ncbi:hypothetical protein [Tamilnaduibacter salinus]|uniref:hypothetical protein n=1 Tax=Tamilnaduibacter salinus TaxID=1484056 RepID=UPI001057E660|nr:hypothetical protein [Tamilnaduibacter salinus]
MTPQNLSLTTESEQAVERTPQSAPFDNLLHGLSSDADGPLKARTVHGITLLSANVDASAW